MMHNENRKAQALLGFMLHLSSKQAIKIIQIVNDVA